MWTATKNNCANTPRARQVACAVACAARGASASAHLGELCCKNCATSDHAGLWPSGQAGLGGTFWAMTLPPEETAATDAIPAGAAITLSPLPLPAAPLATLLTVTGRQSVAATGTARTGGRGGGANPPATCGCGAS